MSYIVQTVAVLYRVAIVVHQTVDGHSFALRDFSADLSYVEALWLVTGGRQEVLLETEQPLEFDAVTSRTWNQLLLQAMLHLKVPLSIIHHSTLQPVVVSKLEILFS